MFAPELYPSRPHFGFHLIWLGKQPAATPERRSSLFRPVITDRTESVLSPAIMPLKSWFRDVGPSPSESRRLVLHRAYPVPLFPLSFVHGRIAFLSNTGTAYGKMQDQPQDHTYTGACAGVNGTGIFAEAGVFQSVHRSIRCCARLQLGRIIFCLRTDPHHHYNLLSGGSAEHP